MGSDENQRIVTLIVIGVILFAFFTGIGTGGGEAEDLIVGGDLIT